MKMTQQFGRTLREAPADADIASHQLLIRAGYIRRLASGIYAWLPLGQRVLSKVADIVRAEMDASGGQEITLPIAQPLELWARTGRDQTYGPLMFRMEDRKGAGFCLSPTAEEAITAVVAGESLSYRDLPVNLYQINWKYRDELRPRFGLLRAREFLMKDAYSFHVDNDDLSVTYQKMFSAYCRIFDQCSLTYRAVEAQAGEIGGEVNHEFMAAAAVGEDDFVWCRKCDYAANIEAAQRQSVPNSKTQEKVSDPEVVHTPGLTSIDDVAAHLDVEPSDLLKCIAFDIDGDLGLAVIPGDREVNEYALIQALAPRSVRLFDDEDFVAHPDVFKGYLGPDFSGASIVVADSAVAEGTSWITGANAVDQHRRNVCVGRDFLVSQWIDLAVAANGDPCPRCGEPLSVDRGIEIGHVFQLGTKYSEALEANYVDESGTPQPMVMGCYGIGVSRIVSAVVEEHHDENGICWPAALAPYDVHLVVLPGRAKTPEQIALSEEVERAGEELYRVMTEAGISVLFDDRDVSPGVKFADADLLGMPVRLTLGAKGFARGVVERLDRATGEERELALTDDILSVALTELRLAILAGAA